VLGVLNYPFRTADYSLYLSHHRGKREAEARALAPAVLGLLRQTRSRTFRVLDIGCGDGSLAIQTAREVKKLAGSRVASRTRPIALTLVEPDQESLRQALHSLESDSELSGGLSIATHNLKIEDLATMGKRGRRFDVILCSHVLYYVKDWVATIEHLVSLLRPGGRIFVVLASASGSMFALHSASLEIQGNGPNQVIPYYAEHLTAILEKTGVIYRSERLLSEITFTSEDCDREIVSVMAFLYHCSPETCTHVLKMNDETLWTEQHSDGRLTASYVEVIFQIAQNRTGIISPTPQGKQDGA